MIQKARACRHTFRKCVLRTPLFLVLVEGLTKNCFQRKPRVSEVVQETVEEDEVESTSTATGLEPHQENLLIQFYRKVAFEEVRPATNLNALSSSIALRAKSLRHGTALHSLRHGVSISACRLRLESLVHGRKLAGLHPVRA